MGEFQGQIDLAIGNDPGNHAAAGGMLRCSPTDRFGTNGQITGRILVDDIVGRGINLLGIGIEPGNRDRKGLFYTHE